MLVPQQSSEPRLSSARAQGSEEHTPQSQLNVSTSCLPGEPRQINNLIGLKFHYIYIYVCVCPEMTRILSFPSSIH